LLVTFPSLICARNHFVLREEHQPAQGFRNGVSMTAVPLWTRWFMLGSPQALG
jgi:hypothetical protein